MKKHKTLKQLIVSHDNDYGFDVSRVIKDNDASQLPSLSIVIPYYETGGTMKLTLKYLYDALVYVKEMSKGKWFFEVIVVDDGSIVKRAIDHIDKELKNIRLVTLPENMGRTEARNYGIKNAIYEKCLFIDSDILIAKEYIYRNLLVHAHTTKKVITVGFFQFIDKSDAQNIGMSEITCEDIILNDYRIDCLYGSTWIGCEKDKEYIGKNFKIVNDTNFFKKWPCDGFYGPWFLTNMILGGFFIVDTRTAKKCNGFDSSFNGYGFTETSLPTKLIAGFGHYLIPVIQGGCLHVDDKSINVSREKKDAIFRKRHNFYFNHYLNLTWEQSLKGYEKR